MNTITESSTYASEDQKSVIYSNILIIDIEPIVNKVLPYIKIDINNIDAQKIFLNYFIIELCESIKTINYFKYIFFVNTKMPSINKEQACIYLSLIEKVLKILSITYIKKSKTLCSFYKNLVDEVDDELISLEIIKTNSKKKTNIKKILNFLSRNGLTFLHNTYFKNPSNKLILFR
jgi:hypothetical protein